MRVSLLTIPDAPVVGNRTQLRLTLEDGGSIEKYLGAWGHMLVASDDLIDMMHEHPNFADGGPQLEMSRRRTQLPNICVEWPSTRPRPMRRKPGFIMFL